MRYAHILVAPIALSLGLVLWGCGPDPRAHNRTLAQGVIENSRVQGVFEDASTPEQARVRHVESGMVCVMPSDGAFQLEVFPPGARNEGAACTRADGGVAFTLMAMRFDHPVSLDQAFNEGVAMSARLEGVSPWNGAPSPADAEIGDRDRVIRMTGRVNGQEVYLRIAMSEANGWFVQQLVFAPVAAAETAERAAGDDWRSALSQFDH